MIEEISILVDKIALKKPNNEIQAKQILKDFLAKKNFADLDLELRDLIEISINYTQLNSVAIITDDFLDFFQSDGSLKPPVKVYLNFKDNPNDCKVIEEIQEQIKLNIRNKNLITLKVTDGLVFNFKGESVFRWEKLYLSDNKIYGFFKFNRYNNKFSSLEKEKIIQMPDLKILKNGIQGILIYDEIYLVIKILLEHLNNEKGSKKMDK